MSSKGEIRRRVMTPNPNTQTTDPLLQQRSAELRVSGLTAFYSVLLFLLTQLFMRLNLENKSRLKGVIYKKYAYIHMHECMSVISVVKVQNAYFVIILK